MTRFEGHQRKINKPAEVVYNFLSNFNNFQQAIPADKIENWQSDEDSCFFTLKGIGDMALVMDEKKPYSIIKIKNAEESKYEFMFWVQLKQLDDMDTRLKLTFDVKLNAMIKMVAKKPLQDFITKLTDQIAESFNR